jgi:EAL domain-containing protein (putative c-di-GMP-specific phosphodiesterase class I)/HAMP domain-containing protein
MSLKNQFLIGSLIAVLTVFALLFVGTGIRLQHYFQAQLSSHAQDTATSLAVAVNSALRQQDMTLLDTTVQAVFDSGYYKRIAVLDTTGKKVIEKQQPPANGNVPGWLPEIVKLDTPLRSAFVTSGWKQAGVVEVTSQPDFAYRELWQLMQDATIWLLAAILITMLLMATLVRSILRPLVKIEKAALAVSTKQFPTIVPIPRTRELGRVVEAFNSLSSSVRMMLGEAENLAERFRKQTLIDTLTGLGNRRSLNANIEMLQESPQGEYALALLQIEGLAKLNSLVGHEQGDWFVRALADALAEVPRLSFIARVRGTTFALLLDFTSESALKGKLDAICLRLESVCQNFGLTGEGRCAAGAVRLFHSDTASRALTKVDEALARSHKFGSSVIDCAQSTGMPSGQWKEYLQKAISTDRFRLYVQPVVGYAGDQQPESAQLLHFEAYSRLVYSDGKLIKAARFMPIAIRHNLAADIDRLCLRKLLQHMKTGSATGNRYAFNISHEILRDPAFPAWLSDELHSSAVSKSNLILEVSESILLASPQEAGLFSEALLVHGLSFGIDQFGLQKATVTELARLQPVYFKLATDLTRNCVDVAEYGEYIAWLVKTSEILGIPVIATCVEKEAWHERLIKAGVSGFQGQLIGPVVSLENPDDIEQD